MYFWLFGYCPRDNNVITDDPVISCHFRSLLIVGLENAICVVIATIK